MITLTVVSSLKDFLTAANIKYIVNYAIESSPLGSMLVATINRYVCCIKFFTKNAKPYVPEDKLLEMFPGCTLNKVSTVSEIVNVSKLDCLDLDIALVAEGTPLQEAVWQELLKIPAGKTLFYSEIAERIGKPKAVRAVASAVGKNPIVYVIPCHRVIGKNGNMFKFGCGAEVKVELLKREGFIS